ncbi:winged helix-turn-helix domain-containing protein [Coprobacter sp.]
MEIIPIGEKAGKLWEILESGSEFSANQLESKLDMSRDDLFSAVGWLAREGKIFCRKQNDELFFSNKYIQGYFCFG